jgi:hypothetical protein
LSDNVAITDLKKEDKLEQREQKEQKEQKEPQGKKIGQPIGGVVQSLKKKKKMSKTSKMSKKTSKESSRKKIEVEAEYSMSNERLKAYGLNPKKLKKKLFNQKMNPKD